MVRWIFLFVVALSPTLAYQAKAQVLLSQYTFDSDLANSQDPTTDNGMVAPDGTFREGTDSATAPTGTPIFVTGIDGVEGHALVLDGVDDWIDITVDGHPGAQTGTDFFTFGPGLVSGSVMAWVKVGLDLTPNERWLMGSLNEDFQSFQMGWNGGQLETVVRSADGPSSQFAIRDTTNDETWADGAWHHLAMSWDSAGNSGNLYIDGNAVGPAITPGSTIAFDSVQTPWEFPMAIGARNTLGTLSGFWEGALDDLRIYGDALSEAQIQTIIADTPIATEPDFDSDGDVDGGDFLAWQRGFLVGATFAEGDANGDMVVDGVDLALWQASFGNGSGQTNTMQAVPEPASVGLVALGVLLATIARRRESVAA